MVEYERRFDGLAMTQLDRLYRGADGVAKPGRLLADLTRLSRRQVRRR